MSLFDAPQAPQEDPAVAAARASQQRQAEADLTGQIQTDLQRRTRSRLQAFGFTPTPADFSVTNAFAPVRNALANSASGFGTRTDRISAVGV